MKKALLFSTLILFCNIFLFAQEETTSSQQEIRDLATYYHMPKKHHFNIGIGLLNLEEFSLSLVGASGAGKPSPSINLSYDYALTRDFGVGLMMKYYRVDANEELNININDLEEFLGDPECLAECLLGISLGGTCDCDVNANVKQRTNVFTIAGKFSYHLMKFEKLNTYSTLYLGYSINRHKTVVEQSLESLLQESDVSNNYPTFIYFISAGARYYVNPKIGIFGEFGYGNTHLLQLGMTYRMGKK